MDRGAAPLRAPGAHPVAVLLAQTPLFRGLARDEILRIAAGTMRVSAPRGRILFQGGDPCTGFYLVMRGQVKLAIGTAAGAEKVVEILESGRSFGEALMFTGRPHIVTATALVDSVLLHVLKQTIEDELDRDPQLARGMLAGLSMRLHTMVKDVEAMALHSATQRVIGYLARLAEEGGPQRVRLPAAKSLIASRLNVTAEYFSRILHGLAARGLVKIEGRDIEILDAQGLRDYGEPG